MNQREMELRHILIAHIGEGTLYKKGIDAVAADLLAWLDAQPEAPESTERWEPIPTWSLRMQSPNGETYLLSFRQDGETLSIVLEDERWKAEVLVDERLAMCRCVEVTP